MNTFYEATKGNVASAGLALDEWRPLFNERHTGNNQKSKNTAFRRARAELVNKGLLKCRHCHYSQEATRHTTIGVSGVVCDVGRYKNLKPDSARSLNVKATLCGYYL